MNQPQGNKKTGPGNYEPSPITQWKQMLHEKCCRCRSHYSKTSRQVSPHQYMLSVNL